MPSMRLLLPLLTCLSLQLLSPAQAETFKVGVELQPYLPYSNVQDGEYLGYGHDLLDAFAAHQGHVFIYQPLPVRRLLSDFLNDRVDFKYPDNPRWNADQKQGYALHYSQAAAPAIDGVLVKPRFLGQGKERLRRLGTQRGFTPWPYLDEINAGKIMLIQANQIDSLLAMAMSDRVDGVYLNPQVVRHQLYNNAGSGLVFDPKLPYQDDHYFLSSIKHPEVIAQFDAFLTSQAELVQSLKDRHGISDPLNGH
jgi:polar amino acid transport system substrate-binding protein